MSSWLVILAALIGVPIVLFVTGMGMIFWSAGLAGGPQESRAQTIVYGWLAMAWGLVSVFGAFGLAPTWRAWHGAGDDFGGSLQAFVDWFVDVGAVGVLVAAAVRGLLALRRGADQRSPLLRVARWLLYALGMLPWAALVAWIAWPLVLWPLRGAFAWPDATTGWTHAGEVVLILLAAMGLEDAVRKLRKR